MKTLSEYLDEAAKVTGSDYKTAQRLEMTRSAISKCRKDGVMKTANIVALAEIIGEDPGRIIAVCDIAKHPEHRAIWQKWGAVAAVILSVGAANIVVENQAVAGVSEGTNYTLCVPSGN